MSSNRRLVRGVDKWFRRTGRQRMCFEPERARDNGRIDLFLFPPRRFIAASVDLAMVSAAQRDGELVADLASEGAALRESEVVSI